MRRVDPLDHIVTGKDVDADRLILLNLDLDLLRAVCVTDRYTAHLCNGSFWRQRFEREFVPLGESEDEVNYRRLLYNLAGKSPRYVLNLAADRGYPPLVRYAIDHGANDLDEALIRAIEASQWDVFNLLLDLGANVNPEEGTQPLFTAADENEIEMVKVLLERGANPHHSYGDVLIREMQHGNEKMVNLLLDYILRPPISRYTSQYLADIFDDLLTQGNREMATLMIERVPPQILNVQTKERALLRAAQRNDLEMVAFLIDHGVPFAFLKQYRLPYAVMDYLEEL